MEREQILRDDFQTVRKGWDPDEVRDHLRAVADSLPPTGSGAPLADVAAERVRGVIAAAEQAAVDVRAQAQTEADRTLTAARTEAESLRSQALSEADSILAEARGEASQQVAQAFAAVEGLVAQADELRSRVGTLGQSLEGDIRPAAASTGGAPAAEVPGPVTVPEPTPPTIPEPTPDPVPEPTPDPVPEPTPDPTPDPLPPDPVPEPTPEPTPDPEPMPAPDPEPPQPAAGGNATTEDLIAQLRGAASGSTNGAASPTTAEPTVSGSSTGAARLVAMNMALEGADRERIADQIHSEFGKVAELESMLDDVLARAAR